MKFSGSLCLLLLVISATLALPPKGEAAELEKLTVCYSTIAGASVSVWIPKEAGIYKKHGLDVSLVYVAGSQSAATLISGDAQIVQGSGAAAIFSRLSGSDLTIVGTVINVIPMSLVTKAEITSPQQIKGKTFGVSRYGSLTDLGLKKAVSEWGLDPDKDIKTIQTGGVPQNLLFLERGVIDGALISSPTLEKAKEAGYRELLNLADLKFRYPSTALITTESFKKARPETLKKFLMATIEGIKYAKANPDFTTKILGKYTRTKDKKQLATAFQTYVLGYIRDIPTVSSAEIESALEEIASRNPKAKGAQARRFYDPVPIEQLVKEGWIRRPSSR